jgi:putative heme-binding domain-containing protein
MGKLLRVRALIGAAALAWAAVNVPATAQGQQAQYSAADIQAGNRLYGLQCAICHGQNGDSINGVNLSRSQFRRASTDNDIRNTVTTGVTAAGMPPFRFQPAELNALVAFIRSGFDRTGAAFRVGDARRGQTIYEGKGGCASCHRVNGKGVRTAPDLSDIGAVRQPAAIQRSLVEPNAAMLPINRPVRIVTRDGRTIQGRRINEDTFTVQLMDGQERLVSLEKTNIQNYEIRQTSEMPSFAGKLSTDEIADLVAYLISLKG